MGLAPSSFRSNDQERITRTVANIKENSVNGSTNDPNPSLTGSGLGLEGYKVLTIQKGTAKTDLSTGRTKTQVSTIKVEGQTNLSTPFQLVPRNRN